MGPRLQRACLAAVLLLTLVVPAVTSAAGVKGELKKKKEELEKVQKKIDKLEGEAAEAKARLDWASQRITDLQKELNQLDADIATIETTLAGDLAQIERAEKQIERIEQQAKEQAVALYKAGTVDTLNTLLTSSSLAELNDRVQILGIAAEQNTNALLKYHRLKGEVRHEKREYFERRDYLNEKQDRRAAALSEINAVKTQYLRDLQTLEKKLGTEEDREGKLEAKLGALIRKAQASGAYGAIASSAGYVWPLNGNVTSPYGYRWGRMHSGIDIDGYTGQGIVASNSGVVILASYYSGYGNAVIVDHGGGISTLYAHMSAFAVSKGQRIGQGQVVGYVGCTGSCTGDHLHFEVRVNGSHTDPMNYLP